MEVFGTWKKLKLDNFENMDKLQRFDVDCQNYFFLFETTLN